MLKVLISDTVSTSTQRRHRLLPPMPSAFLLSRFFLFGRLLFTFLLFPLTPVMELVRDPYTEHGNNRNHIDRRAGDQNLRINHFIHRFHLVSPVVTGGSTDHRRLQFSVKTGNRHLPLSRNHPQPCSCRQEARRHGSSEGCSARKRSRGCRCC